MAETRHANYQMPSESHSQFTIFLNSQNSMNHLMEQERKWTIFISQQWYLLPKCAINLILILKFQQQAHLVSDRRRADLTDDDDDGDAAAAAATSSLQQLVRSC